MPVRPEQLVRRCEAASIDTRGAELPALDSVIGQERAKAAVGLAIAMPREGYHLFVMGPQGSGKKSLAVQAIDAQRARVPAARSDWVYVNNFAQPHQPLAIELPPGRGAQLRSDMTTLVDNLQATIPAVFQSDEYTSQAGRIAADINRRGANALNAVVEEANSHGIAMVHTPGGFTFAPQKNGEVTPPDEFEKLPDQDKERIAHTIEALQEQLVRVLRNTLKLSQEQSARIRDLNRRMTLLAIEHVVDELKARYTAVPRVLQYLDAVQADVLENADDFRRAGEPDDDHDRIDKFRRYKVNLLIDAGSETPVVHADLPSYQNLVGRIDHLARLGTLITDFTLIHPGALHQANGGYLLIDAIKVLTQPFAWAALKRALKRSEVRIESMAEMYSIVSTVRLEPQPIPLRVKAVLFGDRHVYELLLELDPEFGELFRIAADLSDDFPRNAAMEAKLAQALATHARSANLLPLQSAALARLVDHGARLAGDAHKLTARVQMLIDLAVEADYAARNAGQDSIAGAQVLAAVAAQRQRAARLHERVQEAMVRGTLLIDTSGSRIGQVNALAVYEAGGVVFGEPTRVTATTRFGEGKVVDIQRETELGGAIHSKGVLILAAFLAARYSEFSTHSIVASLVFEQTYSRVEGDSASLAEVVALMSSLAEEPVSQAIAVTGSVNQLGFIQAVGAVNEKIEGFFDLCQARGLDGNHGVVIPAANVQHLMLRDDVVQAVAAGRFAVHAVETVDQAIEILTAMPAGSSVPPWDDATVNGRIARRLAEYAALRRGERRFGIRPRPEAPHRPLERTR